MTQRDRDAFIYAIAIGFLLVVGAILLGLAAMIVWEMIR
jgi:hypothetical protein